MSIKTKDGCQSIMLLYSFIERYIIEIYDLDTTNAIDITNTICFFFIKKNRHHKKTNNKTTDKAKPLHPHS